MTKRKARVGLVGLGLQAYWPQFTGLQERLTGYVNRVAQRLADNQVEVVNLGLIDTPQAGMEAGHTLRRQDVDILVLYPATYALSAIVLPVVLRARVPVLLLNLQPEAAIDYARFNRLGDRTAMTGDWLAFCGACPMPEIANVLKRAGIPFQQATGMLEEEGGCWKEIDEWMQAANVVEALRHNRMGLVGHYYSGMLDIATDLTAVASRFGGHFEMLEVDTLSALRQQVTGQQVQAHVALFAQHFDVQTDCDAGELSRAARTAVALDRLVEHNELNSLAYFYSGSGNPSNEDTMSSIILGTSLLTARGVPVAGEYEVKNALAMKIMDELGAGGSFTEIYAMDFADDVVLMGHDGPGHAGIAQGRCKVRPLDVYHGKVGRGLSVEMSVRAGPVTVLSIAEDGSGGFILLIAEGHVERGPILEIGNTNSRYRFDLGVRRFMEAWIAQGPAHHCATGIGHVATKLKKIASLLGIKAVQIC